MKTSLFSAVLAITCAGGVQAAGKCGKGYTEEECARTQAQAQSVGYCYTGPIVGMPYLMDVLPKDICSTATSSVNKGVASDPDGNPRKSPGGSTASWRSHEYKSNAEAKTFKIVSLYGTVATGGTTIIGTPLMAHAETAKVFLMKGGHAELWATGETGVFNFVSPAAMHYLAQSGRPVPVIATAGNATRPPVPSQTSDDRKSEARNPLDAVRGIGDALKKLSR